MEKEALDLRADTPEDPPYQDPKEVCGGGGGTGDGTGDTENRQGPNPSKVIPERILQRVSPGK